MSETTQKIEAALKSARQTFGGQVEMIVPLSVPDLERIARLLTEEDERQARRGHRDRSRQALDGVARYQPWSRQLRDWYGNANLDDDEAPLPSVETLDRLEAAYLAATEQER